MTRVLGVDPGTAATGYGIVERRNNRISLRECGVIRTRSSDDLAPRLREIFEGIGDVIDRTSPDVVGVEGLFYGRNVKTTVVLGHTRGAILLAAALRELPITEYSPAEVKKAVVGTGRATKDQVQFMVQRLLRLKAPPEPKDAADGVAVAICHAHAMALPSIEPRRMPAPAGGAGD